MFEIVVYFSECDYLLKIIRDEHDTYSLIFEQISEKQTKRRRRKKH